MCGIHAILSIDPSRHNLSPELERRLRNRGPDHVGTVDTQLDGPAGQSGLFLNFTSTVLALRGGGITEQPLINQESGSVLCWNGEAWKIGGSPVKGNDANDLFSKLMAVATSSANKDSVLDVLRSVEGPFAFIYLDKPARRLYYGRDRLGRRSLLLLKTGEQFTLSSLADSPSVGWHEVEADGCYTVELGEAASIADLLPVRYDWNPDTTLVSSIGVFNDTIVEHAPPLTRESRSVQQLLRHLTESLQLRVLNVPVPPNCIDSDARVAILFSGGLDCTVLARITSDLVPADQAIDLINVAFENPRIASQNSKLSTAELYELCPDRVTGRKSFEELLTVCPARPWRFVTVNVPYEDTRAHRGEVIDLIYPHNTEMDLSIAFALYFAARGLGKGQSSLDEHPEAYSSTARILLSGLGADELFGGYIRHATAFSRSGYSGLLEEVKLDVSRLGKRNLGRDDRVMAHWSREVRFPYLDENLVKWAIELPVSEKCDFENEENDEQRIEPGKRVLRLLANQLGMTSVATEKKRAIQFGARTAKMESGRVKGTTLILA